MRMGQSRVLRVEDAEWGVSGVKNKPLRIGGVKLPLIGPMIVDVVHGAEPAYNRTQ